MIAPIDETGRSPEKTAGAPAREDSRGTHGPVLAIPEHRALLEALVPLPAPLGLPLEECRGLIAASDARALVPVPAFTNSAMDGFALRSADLVPNASGGLDLPVAGDAPAGDERANVCAPGTAWRIMTGAPVPEGADTVVKVEWTDHEAGVCAAPARVRLHRLPSPGANVRLRGEGVGVGDLVVPAGSPLTAGALAAAASVGLDSLLVHPRPRVLVVATGAELVAPGDPLGPGRIHDSNGVMLAALAAEAGAEVVGTLVSDDDPDAFLDLLADAPGADLVLTAGGVSQGAFEVVRLAVGKNGRFHHVAQQPGGPQGLGTLPIGPARAPTPAICLPGNPVSVFVSFHVYVAGLLARLAGRASLVAGSSAPTLLPGVSAASWRSPAGKTQFVPVRPVPAGDEDRDAPSPAASGAPTPIRVEPVHLLGSGSHLTGALALAEFLAVVGPERDAVAPGEPVELLPILGRGRRA